MIIRHDGNHSRRKDTGPVTGNTAKINKMVRLSAADIKLAPEYLEVKITYNIPEPLVHSDLAGGGFEPPTSGL
jgi:hypothetical protein